MEPSSAKAKAAHIEIIAPMTQTRKKQHRMRQWSGNVFCGKKNRGADDAAGEQQDGVEQREAADQTVGSALRNCS